MSIVRSAYLFLNWLLTFFLASRSRLFAPDRTRILAVRCAGEGCPHKDIYFVIARFRERLGVGRPPLSDGADKDAVRVVDEAWRRWLMRTEVPDARAAMRDNGIAVRSCRAIWLHILLLNRAKGLIPL